jgi:hypothetical protein
MIRFLGFVSFVIGVALVALFFLNSNARTHGGHDVSASIYVALYCLLVGGGMLFNSRIAALLFSIPCAGLAIWLSVGSMRTVPFPWVLFNLAFSSCLLIPLVMTVYMLRRRHAVMSNKSTP